MPCYSVRRTPITWARCKNKVGQVPLLIKALTALGYETYQNQSDGIVSFNAGYGASATYTISTGEFNIPATLGRWDLNRVKQEYSKQVVRAQAARFGRNLTEETAGDDCVAEFAVTHRRME